MKTSPGPVANVALCNTVAAGHALVGKPHPVSLASASAF